MPLKLLTITDLQSLLPPRPRAANKSDFGHVLVIGGAPGMSGAARMAGEAAARVGAGLTSIATRPEHAALLSVGRPELMSHGIADAQALQPLLSRATVIVLGPGLGQSPWARELWQTALQTSLPVVIDADALNLLAEQPLQRGNWVLTPHPGEAARLLQSTTDAIQADRLAAVQALQARFTGVAILKGAGTLVASGDAHVGLCEASNPGMASGGMGDVLSGVIGGLIAQGLSLREAAELGVCLHAAAGDQAARVLGERGLLALDLMPYLQQWVNRC